MFGCVLSRFNSYLSSPGFDLPKLSAPSQPDGWWCYNKSTNEFRATRISVPLEDCYRLFSSHSDCVSWFTYCDWSSWTRARYVFCCIRSLCGTETRSVVTTTKAILVPAFDKSMEHKRQPNYLFTEMLHWLISCKAINHSFNVAQFPNYNRINAPLTQLDNR